MRYFPDEPAKKQVGQIHGLPYFPLLYLIVGAPLFQPIRRPGGRQVDPEFRLCDEWVWPGQAGYPMMKNDHPGTTDDSPGSGSSSSCGRFLAGRSDVIEFGLKNYDAIIYYGRAAAAEAVILSGVLLVSRKSFRSARRRTLPAAAAARPLRPRVNATKGKV